MARLLQCSTCLTLEKLPDYDGTPEDDVTLDHLIKPHRFPDGEPHIGQLFRGIPDKYLENMESRKKIERDIWQAKADQASFKDTFVEEAGKCFNAHGRPKLGCIDYKDDSKRIGNPALTSGDKAEMKAAGFKQSTRHLCEFCPVHSYVTSSIMSKQLDMPSRRFRRGSR